MKFKLIKDVHPENIFFILVTDNVLKLVISNSLNRLQDSNKEFILTTFDVSNIDKSKLGKE